MKHALILSGGGAKGAFQAGVIDALQNAGESFDLIAGVSVGALNGSMVATGQIDTLRGIWNNITEDQVLRRRGAFRKTGAFILHKIGIHRAPKGYFDNSPLRQLLFKHLEGKRCHIPFMTGDVDIETGEYHETFIGKGRVIGRYEDEILRILASTAIPVVFDPVELRGRIYVDGGVRVQTPIGRILEMDPDRITVITCGNPNTTFDSPVKDIVDIADNTISTMTSEIFDKDIREFQRINDLVDQISAGIDQVVHETPTGTFSRDSEWGNDAQALAAKMLVKGWDDETGLPTFYQHYPARIITPPESLGSSLNFGYQQARENYRLGIQVGKEYAEKNPA